MPDTISITDSGWSAMASATPAPLDVRERQRSFEAALGRASSTPNRSSPVEMARDSSEQLITQCLIIPVLKMAREGNRPAPPFAPSQGEKQFGALSYAQLAQRITSASHFPLVDRLARDLLKRAGLGADGVPLHPRGRGPVARTA